MSWGRPPNNSEAPDARSQAPLTCGATADVAVAAARCSRRAARFGRLGNVPCKLSVHGACRTLHEAELSCE